MFKRHTIPLSKGDTLLLDVNDDGLLRAIYKDEKHATRAVSKSRKLSEVLEDALQDTRHKYQTVLAYVRSTGWGELLP